MIDQIDYDYLQSLVKHRDEAQAAANAAMMAGYWQGRIREYCAQNAVEQSDVQELDLKR